MFSAIQSWFDLSKISSWRPGGRRRRNSFNRDRRCSFPELSGGTGDSVVVGYSPKVQPDEVSAVVASVASSNGPSSRQAKSKSFLRKYLLCGCCSCCSKTRAQSYSPRTVSHEEPSEDPATLRSRVYQSQNVEQTPSSAEAASGGPSLQMAQLSADDLIKSSKPPLASSPPIDSHPVDSPEPVPFHVPNPPSSTSSHASFLAKLSKKSKISIANSGPPEPISSSVSIFKSPKMVPNQAKIEVSTKRLMKELGDLMKRQQTRSSSFDSMTSTSSGGSSKSRMLSTKSQFTVELVNDLLYEWYIKIYEFDRDSQIYQDMQQFKVPYVKLHAVFPDSYPFDPPFIRVVAPYIERGYVMEGGAICLELLTKTGWTSAYTMEAVIIQLMASFVKGQARIKANKDVGKCFTRKSAETSFRHIVRIHDKHGWVDTPIYEG